MCSGAGYPSSYYPYIIATLVDTVPQQCGGTGGQVGRLDRKAKYRRQIQLLHTKVKMKLPQFLSALKKKKNRPFIGGKF